MLTHLSWNDYFMAVALLLTLYYLVILAVYFRKEAQALFNRNLQMAAAAPDLAVAQVNIDTHNPLSRTAAPDEEEELADQIIDEMDQLIIGIKTIIQTRSEKPFAHAALISELKTLFKTHSAFKDSPHRPAINELVVSECEKTGVALLTEAEVDQWWV